MPLVQVHVPAATPPSVRKQVAEVIGEALVRTADAPAGDRLTLFHSYAPGDLHIEPHYSTTKHQCVVFIQIVLNQGRSSGTKETLFRALSEGVALAAGVGPDDIITNLVEVPPENWSFGRGLAQWAPRRSSGEQQ